MFSHSILGSTHTREKCGPRKKRAEGKFYKEATIAVARKLIYRIYAVWKRQTPYVT
jgi:hypothetical protein